MDIKAFNQALQTIKKRNEVALEKIEQIKEICNQNESYSSLEKQLKLNTLALSKALANNQSIEQFEKIDSNLNKQILEIQNKVLSQEKIYYCPKCKDTGIVNDKYCDCLLCEYKKILHQKSSNYQVITKFTFKDNKIAEIKCKQAELINKLYNNMYLFCNDYPNTTYLNYSFFGKTGVGKSCLLYAIYNELIEKNIFALYITANDLSDKFLEYHTTKLEDGKQILDDIYNAEVLLIDDLGIEKIFKNVTLENFLILLTKRTNKHTIYASNLTLDETQEKYGDRIFSRLTDKTNTDMRYIDGDDLRHILKNRGKIWTINYTTYQCVFQTMRVF